jgi:uncharacterized membrane protein YphA (DoxX/SURF4 family)
VGLLLLRTGVAGVAILAAGRLLNQGSGATVWMYILGALCLSSGLLLLAGFLTPVAGGVAAFGVASTVLLQSDSLSLYAVDEWLSTALVVVMATALELLGPGALSVDARLFGRREIIIRRL